MISAFPRLSAAQQELDAGRYHEAAHLALGHVREHPNEPRGLGLLATVALKTGALGQAEHFFRQAYRHAPTDPRVLDGLATCMIQQERPTEALMFLEKLESARPGNPQTGLMKASTLDKIAKADEARALFEHLVEQHPKDVNLKLAYAHNLRSAGQIDLAVQAYRDAIDLDFERGDAWWGLASIRKTILTDADIRDMERAVSVAIDVSNVAPLHFALGRAYHERQQYDRAFEHYSEGNRARAESIGYRAQELTDEVSQTARIFDDRYFAQLGDGGDNSNAPIFIVSLPRSGSTLMEQMLGAHQDVEPLGELPYIPALLRSAMEVAMRRGVTSVPEVVRMLSPADRTAFGAEYLRRAAVHRTTSSPHFTDKLPHNWSNILFIRHILPNARFVDMRRNAMDCCFANFTQSFSRAHASSFALRDIGQCYVDYVRYMAHLDSVAPGMVHHISYERLVDDAEPQLRAAMDYLGLGWDDAVLRFHQLDRVVRTPSSEQVRKPLNRDGIDVWRQYDQWLGPLRSSLGEMAR